MRRSHHRGGLSRRDVDDLSAPMRDAHDYLRSRRDAAKAKESPLATVMAGAEVAAGAAGMGYVYGRTQMTTVGNTQIPLGLAVGVAGHLINMFLLKDSAFSPHLANLANGAIGSWTTMLGIGIGTQGRQKAGLSTTPLGAC
jgi:hypothetical protein